MFKFINSFTQFLKALFRLYSSRTMHDVFTFIFGIYDYVLTKTMLCDQLFILKINMWQVYMNNRLLVKVEKWFVMPFQITVSWIIWLV